MKPLHKVSAKRDAAGNAGPPDSRFWIAALLIFVAALVVRLVVYRQMHAWPLLKEVEALADARYYDMMARQVAAGDLLGSHPYFLSPAFYYVLVLAIARRFFGETTGWIAGGLLALYGYFIYENLMILPDTLVVLLNLIALWVLIGIEERLSLRRALIGGVCIGLAAAARANALLLAPAAGLLILLCGSADRRRRLLACAALGAGCLLAVAPLTLRNYVVAREFVPLTTTGGRNFWKGNGPEANGTHRFLDEEEWGQGLTFYVEGKVDSHEAVADSRRLTAQTWDYIGRHPLDTIGLWIKKLGLFFHAREFGIRDQFYFGRQYSSWLRALPVAFSWLAPLGLVGLLTAWRSRRGRLAAVALLVQVLSFTALFILGRYRLVAATLLVIFAAHQLVWWSGRLRERAWRPILLSAALTLGLVALVNRPLPEFPRREGFGDQYAAIGDYYIKQRDCPSALPPLQQALVSPWLEQPALDATQNSIRYRIGLCQLELGRLQEARATADELIERLQRSPEKQHPQLYEASRQLLQHVERALAREADAPQAPRP
ncbi:MAG: glycosyltransferase family 39 protein [Candidatus Eisenbacteria bacterium]